jgi:formate/nitrite transporter FocA (FNT family)
MYYLFAAYFGGADITLTQIFYNLSVAAIGNFVGGGIIVSGANYLLAFRDIERNVVTTDVEAKSESKHVG